MDIDKIADFIIKYTDYDNKELVKDYIKDHNIYNTYVLLLSNNNKEIKAYVRFNIDNITAYILDLIINPKYRYKDIIRELLYKGHNKFPNVRFAMWYRRSKYPDRRCSIYSVKQLLKGERNGRIKHNNSST